MSSSSDDSSFLLTFPLWFIINSTERQRPFVELKSAGKIATPLFTDKDLVERFMNSVPGMRENYRIGAIPAPPVLLQFLEGFQAKGFSHVAIDPSLMRSLFHPIADLRKHIAAAFKDSEGT